MLTRNFVSACPSFAWPSDRALSFCSTNASASVPWPWTRIFRLQPLSDLQFRLNLHRPAPAVPAPQAATFMFFCAFIMICRPAGTRHVTALSVSGVAVRASHDAFSQLASAPRHRRAAPTACTAARVLMISHVRPLAQLACSRKKNRSLYLHPLGLWSDSRVLAPRRALARGVLDEPRRRYALPSCARGRPRPLPRRCRGT